MPQVINTNVISLNAQRNLNKSQNALAVTLQRLSSGLRINSAKDDAAGLAISNRQTAQIRGANVAARNASDAISLAQTGEGGLQEITNNLQRLRELAIQSRNATNTASDRASLDAEFQQLLAEIDRTAKTTAFNGRNLLDGTLGTSVFQVGANVGETVAVNASSSVRTNSIGQFASQTFTLANELNAAGGETLNVDQLGDLIIGGNDIAAAVNGSNGQSDGSAVKIVEAINASNSVHGVTASASTVSTTITAATISAFAFTDNAANADNLTSKLTINGTDVFTQAETDPTRNASDLAGFINTVSNTTGVLATAQTDGSLVLSTTDGRNIDIQETLAGASDGANDKVTTFFGNSLTGAAAVTHDVFKGSITLTSSKAFTFDIDVAGNGGEDIFTGSGAPTAAGAAVNIGVTSLAAANVLTETASDLAIQRVDSALTDVDSLRGTFGAIQSRFESTVANLQTTAENVSAARSRIRDADFAAETASLTRSQILQQAGISILTQANATPQLALALLQ
ncbi:MAG: flagellin [Gammaproteobacteria bacterium]